MPISAIETSRQLDTSTSEALYGFWEVDYLMDRTRHGGKKTLIENFSFDSMTVPSRMSTQGNPIPRYARRLMRGPSLLFEAVDVSIEDMSRPVYFIGQWPNLEEKINIWGKWASDGMKTKTPSYFSEHFTGHHVISFPVVPVAAWWGIKEDLIWTLSPKVAEALIDMLTER